MDGKADIDKIKKLDILIALCKKQKFVLVEDMGKRKWTLKQAEGRRRSIIKKYDKRADEIILKSASEPFESPNYVVMAELVRVLNCVGRVKIRQVDNDTLGVWDGKVYYNEGWEHRSARYIYAVVKHGKYIAENIKMGGMADDFLKFHDWLKQNETDIVSTISRTEAPILEISPRSVYCHYLYETKKINEIRAVEQVYAIQIRTPGTVCDFDWSKGWGHYWAKLPCLNLISRQCTTTVYITAALVEQIPEIKDLLKRRDELQIECEELTKKIHEEANDCMGKWLALAAL
ncbi:hypothetical protein [Methanocella paludicola]|uniref:hypothetical protein n=1 Tax=Methanocella paludicola TaxID=570267 RepID=UPI0011AE62A8|nr:hypothetical protein [Methanocella paludicola]